MTPRAYAAAATVLCVCAAVPARAVDRAAARKQADQARELLYGGQFREALRAANDAAANDPKNGAAFALRSRVWHILNDPGHEREDAQRALSLIGGGKLDPETLADQSGAYLSLGELDKALEAADAAVAASNQAPEALAARSRAFLELGQPGKAASDLDAALRKNIKVPLWLYARARILYQAGEDKKTVAVLTAALRANKSFPVAFGLLGASLARQNDFARALKAYDRALALDPEYSFARLGRAAIELRQKNEAAALKDFEDAVRADAQDYAPYFNRAEAHWRAGRREQALSDYRNALAAPKLDADAAIAIGDRYMSIQLWKDAVEAYSRASGVCAENPRGRSAKAASRPEDAYAVGFRERPAAPDFPSIEHGCGQPVAALLRRAVAYETMKEPKKALADLDEAVRLKPDGAPGLSARGILESKLGMDKEAQDDLTRAVRLNPKDPATLVARGSFFARKAKPQLALADFDAAIEADPKNAEAYNGRGALRANVTADLDKALLDVLKAVELAPREPGYRFNLGMIRLKNKMYLKAVEAFDAALDLKGPAARVLEQRAEAKFQLGDHVGAKLDIESALEKDPKNPSIYVTLGSMRLRARAYEQAVRDLSQALHLDDGLAPAFIDRGLAFGALGQLKSAAADFRRASELTPRSREVWTDLCETRRLMREPKRALEDCNRALSLDSQYGPAYLQRALAMLALRQYPRVIEDVDTAWQLGTRRAEGLIAKSISHAAARQYKEAHRTYLQAIGVDPYVRSAYIGFAPGHPEGDDFLSAIAALDDQLEADQKDPYVFVLRADSLHNAEQFDKAVLEYTKAMELDGTLADAYVGRGVALTAQDALEAAQQDFVRAIELAPDDADARIRLAVTLTMRRNYSAALTELGKALQLEPKSAEARLRAGNVYYFMKDYAKALDNYALAVKDDPLDANALNGLALGQFAQKRRDDALENFSRAIALNPLADRYYRNRASVWTSHQKFGNAAGDFRTASMVNTDPSLIDEYRRLIDEAESRAATKAT
jgi:tetratricopeptide (TPR) repeat protein